VGRLVRGQHVHWDYLSQGGHEHWGELSKGGVVQGRFKVISCLAPSQTLSAGFDSRLTSLHIACIADCPILL
jgi:hypothetical protein